MNNFNKYIGSYYRYDTKKFLCKKLLLIGSYLHDSLTLKVPDFIRNIPISENKSIIDMPNDFFQIVKLIFDNKN